MSIRDRRYPRACPGPLPFGLLEEVSRVESETAFFRATKYAIAFYAPMSTEKWVRVGSPKTSPGVENLLIMMGQRRGMATWACHFLGCRGNVENLIGLLYTDGLRLPQITQIFFPYMTSDQFLGFLPNHDISGNSEFLQDIKI